MIANYFNVTTTYPLGRDDDIETIVSYHDNDEWTDEELADIEKFKEFIRMKKKNK
jgi:hypothetical protein